MKLAKRFLIWIISLILIIAISVFIFFPLPGNIPVLMYHFLYPKIDVVGGLSSLNVAIEEFEKQMWFLKIFGYRTISLDEYYEIKKGLRKPRGKEVLITFDDGHRTYLEHGLPILTRYGLKSAQFLVWKHLTGTWQHDYFDLAEAKELSQNPLVELGAHSMTHSSLTEIPLTSAKDEIIQSKDYLQKALGKEIKYFCYPRGAFNSDLVEIVRQAGYRLAFRTSLKFGSYPETPYSVSRIKINPKYNLFVFWWYVSGLAHYVKKIDHFFHQLTLSFTNGKLNVYKPAYGTT